MVNGLSNSISVNPSSHCPLSLSISLARHFPHPIPAQPSPAQPPAAEGEPGPGKSCLCDMFWHRGWSVTATEQRHQHPRASVCCAAPRTVPVMSRGTGRACGRSFRDGAMGTGHLGQLPTLEQDEGHCPPAHPAPSHSPGTGSGHRWPRSLRCQPPPRSAPAGKHHASNISKGSCTVWGD